MSIAQPDLNPNPWASSADSGDIVTPSDGQQAAGFTPTIAAPPYQWMNWILKQVSTLGRYLRSRGVPDYNEAEQYSKGDVVQVAGATDTTVYQCKVTPPFNGFSPGNATYWEIFGFSWLPDALESALAAGTLPSLMENSLLGLFGVTKSTGGSAGSEEGLIQLFGWQICWRQLSLHISGNLPTATAFTWRTAFGTCWGAVAVPQEASLVVAVTASNNAGATITPTPTDHTLTWGGASAFVIGIGLAPTS